MSSVERTIKAILFDNDGVLVHTEDFFFQANDKIMCELGVTHQRSDFENYTFETDLGTSGYLKKAGLDKNKIDEFKARRNDLWKKLIQTEPIIDPFTDEVLKILSQEYRLAIITNSPRDLFNSVDRNQQLSGAVDLVLTREDYTNGKPAPDGYLQALELLNILPSQALVVEDSPRGIESALEAGIRVVAIQNPHFPNLETTKATYIIRTLSELPGLISSLDL